MSDQQEFGWLDEILEQHYWDISSDGWKKADIKAKAAIQARFTAQAKQHQAELLQARKEATEANNDLHKRHEDNLTAVHRIELLRARIETNKEILKFIPALQKHSGASWQRGYVSAQQTLRNNIKKNIAYLQTELVKLQDELTKMEDEK